MKLNKKIMKASMIALMSMSMMVSCGGEKEPDIDDPVEKLENDIEFDDDGNVLYEDQVDLKVWCIIGEPDKTKFVQLVNRFNREYAGQINLNVNYIGHYDYYKNLDTTYTTDFEEGFPDMCIMHNEKTTMYADRGYILPMNKLFEKTKINLDFSNCYDNIDRTNKYKDNRYAISMDAHGHVNYIRQDIIKKNELGFDNNTRFIPESHEEYQQLLTGLRTKANNGTLLTRNVNEKADHSWKIANKDIFYPEFLEGTDPMALSALYANSERLASEDGKTITYHQTDAMKNFLCDQVDRFNRREMGESGTNTEMFGAGNTVMFPEGPWWGAQTYTFQWNTAEMKEAKNGISEEDAADPIISRPMTSSRPRSWFTLDSNKNTENATKWYGNGHSISLTSHMKKLSQAAAGLTFAKWLTQGKDPDTDEYNLATWCSSGHIPAWKNVKESPEYQAEYSKNITLQALGQPEDIIAMEPLVNENTIFDTLNTAVQSVQKMCADKGGCNKEQAIAELNRVVADAQAILDAMDLVF